MVYKNFHSPPHACVMFRGGSCGNFLCHAIETHLLKTNLYQSTEFYPEWNEYRFSLDDGMPKGFKPPLTEHHINLWFKRNSLTKYGDEVYKASRYNSMFAYWKDTKFIVIQPNHNIVYTELLGAMKNCIQSGLPHRHINKQHERDDVIYELDYFAKIAKHYNFFSKIGQKKGNHILDVDFGELFFFDTKQQIKRIAEFLDKPYNPMMLKQVRDYHSMNEQLRTKYGYDSIVQLKPLT